jgi:ribosomal protein S18 acetylase RimI-like enzyme
MTVPEPEPTGVAAGAATDPLANAVWHALTGPQQGFAERHGDAARYDPAVSVFAALVDEPDEGSWEDLRALVGPRGVAVLFRERVAAPAGWTVLDELPGVQLDGTRSGGVDRRDDDDDHLAPVDLSVDDAVEMANLVARTEPGPFTLRTHELGHYLGVRASGALVAMAGERMHLAGATEISAVCTDAEHRRRGHAQRLVRVLVDEIRSRGERPFLHAAATNTNALALYERLGFVRLRTVTALVVEAP